MTIWARCGRKRALYVIRNFTIVLFVHNAPAIRQKLEKRRSSMCETRLLRKPLFWERSLPSNTVYSVPGRKQLQFRFTVLVQFIREYIKNRIFKVVRRSAQFSYFDRTLEPYTTVSYTHLTLPTNREV